ASLFKGMTLTCVTATALILRVCEEPDPLNSVTRATIPEISDWVLLRLSRLIYVISFSINSEVLSADLFSCCHCLLRPALARALAEIPDPDECRRNPEAYCLCEDTPQLRRFGEVQGDGNRDQCERDRTNQGSRAPGQASEIEEPEERRHAPVKRHLPKGV